MSRLTLRGRARRNLEALDDNLAQLEGRLGEERERAAAEDRTRRKPLDDFNDALRSAKSPPPQDGEPNRQTAAPATGVSAPPDVDELNVDPPEA